MKALTLKSPWAEHVVYGTKRIENRTWRPPASLHGEVIAIHRGKSVAQPSDYDDPRAREQLRRALMAHPANTAGHIIGTARVVGWYDAKEGRCNIRSGRGDWEDYSDAVIDSGDAQGHRITSNHWWLGPIGWLLDDVRAVEPVPARGMPGLWTVPEGIKLVEVER